MTFYVQQKICLIRKVEFKEEEEVVGCELSFSSSDQRHNDRNLHSRIDSMRERDEHIEEWFWQLTLQRE